MRTRGRAAARAAGGLVVPLVVLVGEGSPSASATAARRSCSRSTAPLAAASPQLHRRRRRRPSAAPPCVVEIAPAKRRSQTTSSTPPPLRSSRTRKRRCEWRLRRWRLRRDGGDGSSRRAARNGVPRRRRAARTQCRRIRSKEEEGAESPPHRPSSPNSKESTKSVTVKKRSGDGRDCGDERRGGDAATVLRAESRRRAAPAPTMPAPARCPRRPLGALAGSGASCGAVGGLRDAQVVSAGELARVAREPEKFKNVAPSRERTRRTRSRTGRGFAVAPADPPPAAGGVPAGGPAAGSSLWRRLEEMGGRAARRAHLDWRPDRHAGVECGVDPVPPRLSP